MSDKEEISFVNCGTTAGPFVMKLVKKWSPNGYDRAVDLFSRGFYDDSHFFRVVPGFLVQFGITYSNDQELRKFARSTIQDDPKPDPPISFHEGTVSFAGGGDNSRTSQLFISYGKAKSLGTQKWETPIGEVVEGMENIRSLYSEYGDMPPWGHGPEQNPIRTKGRKYIEEEFPLLSSFQKCTVSREIGGDKDAGKDEAEIKEGVELPKAAMKEKPAKKREVPDVKVGLDSDSAAPKSPPRLGSSTALEGTGNTMVFAGVLFFLLFVLGIFVFRRSKKRGSKQHMPLCMSAKQARD